MSIGLRMHCLNTGMMVRAPVAVLSVTFFVTFGIALANEHLGIVDQSLVLLAGAGAFGVAALLLARWGSNNLRRLEHLHLIDRLTGLPNRHALHLDIAREQQLGREIALAIVDFGGIKMVNDHYGHATGDAANKACGRLLKETVGSDARIYRLVGSGYAVMRSAELAGTLLEGLCRQLIDRLHRPVVVDHHQLTLNASVGLESSGENEAMPSRELLRRADVAMNVAKRGGRMRCSWFNATFDRSREQFKGLSDALRAALVNGEFHLAYQPVVDSHSGRVVGVESLLRWERPDGERIGPDVFIPIAEQSGLINAIGLWVLRQSCTDARVWPDITLSVNISAAQLRNPEFPIQLGQILEETGLLPGRLQLEVTETCLVLDPVAAERNLDMLRQFGVRVALDDFGTGYASIGFLRQFRFERLKIDRSLVVQAGEDEASRTVMLSSITIARAMNMEVTAEGVETIEQARMVRDAGCDQIQGWLYFTALPASAIGPLLESPPSTVAAPRLLIAM